MSRARKLGRIFGVLVLVLAVGVTFAGPANARMSKAQKKKEAAKLIKQLKKNPRLIKSKRWLRKAGHVNATLPLTVRLNPVVTTTTNPALQKAELASDDTALIDLTSTFGPEVGQKTTSLRGSIQILARFGNPAEGDELGDLRLEVTGASLSAASVGVLDGTGVVPCTFGAGEPARAPSTFQNSPGNGLGNEYASRSTYGATVSRESLAPSVLSSTVVRTDPIEIGAASTNRVSNRGKANLFTSANNVRLDLALTAEVNTIFRSLEDGSGDGGGAPANALPSALFYCDEAWAGQTDSSGLTSDSFDAPSTTADIGPVIHQNLIQQRVTGTLKISPAITTDGKLRIAKVTVSGAWSHNTIDACLQVNKLVSTGDGAPGGAGGSPGDNPITSGTGSIEAAVTLGAAFGSPTYFTSGGPGFPIFGSTAPTTDCDTAYASVANDPAWPLSHDIGDGTSPLVDEITPAASKRLELDPEIRVNTVTAEALIGQGADY